jgi:hypothetical protein
MASSAAACPSIPLQNGRRRHSPRLRGLGCNRVWRMSIGNVAFLFLSSRRNLSALLADSRYLAETFRRFTKAFGIAPKPFAAARRLSRRAETFRRRAKTLGALPKPFGVSRRLSGDRRRDLPAGSTFRETAECRRRGAATNRRHEICNPDWDARVLGGLVSERNRGCGAGAETGGGGARHGGSGHPDLADGTGSAVGRSVCHGTRACRDHSLT